MALAWTEKPPVEIRGRTYDAEYEGLKLQVLAGSLPGKYSWRVHGTFNGWSVWVFSPMRDEPTLQLAQTAAVLAAEQAQRWGWK